MYQDLLCAAENTRRAACEDNFPIDGIQYVGLRLSANCISKQPRKKCHICKEWQNNYLWLILWMGQSYFDVCRKLPLMLGCNACNWANQVTCNSGRKPYIITYYGAAVLALKFTHIIQSEVQWMIDLHATWPPFCVKLVRPMVTCVTNTDKYIYFVGCCGVKIVHADWRFFFPSFWTILT